MERHEVEELKNRVSCAAVLEKAGFAVDEKESTRRAVKYRRGTEIIIVIHAGLGWFDPLSDAKGDVFKLVEHLDQTGFPEALRHVAELVGFLATAPTWKRPERDREPEIAIAERWRQRRMPWEGSASWRYLRDERHLTEPIIRAAIRERRLREGPRGSMWAAHTDGDDRVTGWEERGPDWRGFATGGTKILFRLGQANAPRLCVTEAAIDAMSLAALENLQGDTLYLSTGGGWSPATSAAIRALAQRQGAQLVAATDNNRQGEVFADRIAAIAADALCGFFRMRPSKSDWNEDLRGGDEKGKTAEETKHLPHARLPHQG